MGLLARLNSSLLQKCQAGAPYASRSHHPGPRAAYPNEYAVQPCYNTYGIILGAYRTCWSRSVARLEESATMDTNGWVVDANNVLSPAVMDRVKSAIEQDYIIVEHMHYAGGRS